MDKRFYLFIFALLLVLPLMNASLGTFTQNENISIRVLANCSGINLTEVTTGTTSYIINSPMTHLGGQTFNYTFSNTSILGEYSYSWDNPCVDCSNGGCGNGFTITPNGNSLNSGESITMVWQIVILILALICFMIMGIIFKIDSLKIFFFVLAGLTLFALVGIGLSTAQNYLYAYTQYGAVYSAYYIIMAIVGGTALIGLVIWFLYYTIKKFKKTRIGDIED